MSTSTNLTGRYLVLLKEGRNEQAAQDLRRLAGVQVAFTSGGTSDSSVKALDVNCALVFNHIGVALIRCEAAQSHSLRAAMDESESAILSIEAERAVYAITEDGGADSDGVAEQTWGVIATKADQTAFNGEGIRLAILDTGLDLDHPDFSNRKIEARSFVDGESVQDENGHGTHCAGIAAGPQQPADAPRYGVGAGVQLYIGKVLGNDGGGGDGSVLDGINWAIENGCQIVSMSLGSPAAEGDAYSQIFETAAKRALAAGTLIIAAAGNDSRRPEHIAPVSHPANCPSIMAVAAVDKHMAIAPFSSGGLNADGGAVDIAGPGVDVFSSWPLPERYRSISGTSMATPFVAGVAALYAQAASDARGSLLMERIRQNARPLPLPARDVGAGLVQAPVREASANGSPRHR